MANLAGYIYCSRAERWYTPAGDPETWPAQVHVHAAYDDGTNSYLGVATYTASYSDYSGIGNGYRTEPDLESRPGYYDLVPPALRHVSLPPEEQRTYRWHSNRTGADILAAIGDEFELADTSGIDPDANYAIWVFWVPPIDEYGYFQPPHRIAALTPITTALWQGMPVDEYGHRFAYASDAGGTPLAFWTDRVGVQEVI
jgi:hypothetical protein